ncbi:MAG: glycosyltransferase family 4 protein [Bacteroides sp.]|nr:glycosyltransferase family 4 protein [Bacteroides sp.]
MKKLLSPPPPPLSLHHPIIMLNDNHLGSLIHFRGDVIRALLDSGYSIYIIAPMNKTDKRVLFEKAKLFPIELDRTSVSIYSNLKYLIQTFRILRKNRPEVLINYTIKPILAGSIISYFLGIPSVSFFAGVNSSISKLLTGKDFKSKLFKPLCRAILSVNKYNVFLNKEDLELMTECGIINKEKTILFNGGEGVNVSQYLPSDKKNEKTEKLKLVMVARVLKTKGYNEFACASLKCKNIHDLNAEFYLCGGIDTVHPERVDIDKIKADEKLGGFKYMGHLNNLKEFLSDADCVILPSYYNEGMNRSLMEALSMGIPIITTNNRGCRELVKDGVTGFIIPPQDPMALYDAIVKFLSLSPDKRKSMRQESRLYALERFDVRQVIENYKIIIDKSINAK